MASVSLLPFPTYKVLKKQKKRKTENQEYSICPNFILFFWGLDFIFIFINNHGRVN